MENTFCDKKTEPYFYSCDGIIKQVSSEFMDLTGFNMDELLGKSLLEIGSLLKINSQILLDNIKSTCTYSAYIFTKYFAEAREVNISLVHDSETNEKVYFFIEKPNSRLDDKLIFVEQTFAQNIWGVAVYSVPDLILLKVNQKYLDSMNSIFNKGENSIGKHVREIVTTFLGSLDEVIGGKIIETKKAFYTKEFRVDDPMGGITYWDSTQTPIFENGKMKYIFTTDIDVTDRILKNQSIIEQNKIIQQQKDQLVQQNTQLTSIIENLSEGISTFDNKGQYISFNKSERDMFFPYYEYTSETNDRYYVYIDKTSDSYNQAEFYDVYGDKIDLEQTPFRRVMRGEKFKNMRMVVKLSNKTLQIDVSGTPIYDSEGKFTLGVLCSRNMTDYYKHEESIRSRYEFLNRMIDTFDLPVVRLSCPDLKIVDINKRAFSIVQLSTPNIKSIKQMRDYKFEYLFKISNTSEYYKCIDEVLKENKTQYWNKKSHLINGNEIYWNIIFEPMLDVNGELQEILILIIDVTSEIESNIAMEKTLKLQGEFLVNISHELKTPLNVICTAAQLFNMYCNSGTLDDKKDSIIKYIDSIKQNSYRLSKIINNIVDLSKIEAGFFKLNLSNNNIVEIVEEIVISVTTFTNSKSLNIIFDTDMEEKIITCDPQIIQRIVLNLISNAIKFTNEGDEIFVAVKDKNEFIEISVKDNGIGIEKKNLAMIFDRFKQVDKSLSRNAEGTGIGLSLVKSIVELHGGIIYVESVFGKGSKFTVMLPSKKVLHENKLGKVPSGNEIIRVELSDVYA